MDLRLAPVVLLHLILLLDLQHADHLVDGRLHLHEGVQLHAGGQQRELWIARPAGRGPQGSRGSLPLAGPRRGPPLQQAVGARHGVSRLVLHQNLHGVSHGFQLGHPGGLALLEVLVSIGTGCLQVAQELLRLGERHLLVLEVLLCFGQLVLGGGELVLLLLVHLLGVLDLVRFCGAQVAEAGPPSLLALLRLLQVALHLLLELLEDAEDLAALSVVGRIVGAAMAGLHEGGRRPQRALHDHRLL
mmetsp:Transcript_43663/g.117787  ORF Transcript_43663/g.117787 Transcript_43663/m.117787 type:complete len:245 (-) Transcript_43663:907-1641(-)